MITETLNYLPNYFLRLLQHNGKDFNEIQLHGKQIFYLIKRENYIIKSKIRIRGRKNLLNFINARKNKN